MKGYRLSIDTPCSEEWSAMTINEQGKFCSSCSKNVIDFSRLSDAEIIRILQNNKGNLCGRLNTTQLDRVITIPAEKPSYAAFYKALAGAVLLSATGTLTAKTPGSGDEVVTATRSVNEKEEKTPAPSDNAPFIIKGKVKDLDTGRPLKGCSVKLQNTELNVLTDHFGSFVFIVPDELIKDRLVFEVERSEYECAEFIIQKAQISEETIVQPELKEIKWEPGTPFRR